MKESNQKYINRELSWMDFNKRVLEEACEETNPIMERLNFLAITASNLDEFYRVRVAGVKQQVSSGYDKKDFSGYTPEELLSELTDKISRFVTEQYKTFSNISDKLKENGYELLKIYSLTAKQKKFLSDYFDSVIFPVLTPIAASGGRPFPRVSGNSLNIAVRLKRLGEKKTEYAIMRVPSNIPRYIELPGLNPRQFVMLEDVIIYRIDAFFDSNTVKSCTPFRITRNSDVEIDDEAPDLISEVQKSIKKRKEGKPVRLEILKKCDVYTRDFLIDSFKVKKQDIYKVSGPIDLTFLSKFSSISNDEKMRFEPIVPVYPPADFCYPKQVGNEYDIFKAIREKDRMVHHPYESFQCVVDFLNRAADDPDVLAIKQTLYRVSGHSPIIEALMRAAQAGKQVSVLVELKARFDEENNVGWAQKLERAGCHVIYGISGLKTHCKITMVVRRENDRLRSYIHMATGNYNESTAKLYTDIGIFTCKDVYAADAAKLFNMLTGYISSPQYKKFIVAPHDMRSFFEAMINKEITNAQEGKRSGIVAKVNSLVDPDIIDLLYKASCEGVHIKLLVRGICCLIPGVKGMSDNIEVYSIVGQLLEHSRIFKFSNGGRPKYYMGSADWMQRNLNRRVELIFPIEDRELKKRTDSMLKLMFSDIYNMRIMQPDGEYINLTQGSLSEVNSQREFSVIAYEAQKTSRKEDKKE